MWKGYSISDRDISISECQIQCCQMFYTTSLYTATVSMKALSESNVQIVVFSGIPNYITIKMNTKY